MLTVCDDTALLAACMKAAHLLCAPQPLSWGRLLAEISCESCPLTVRPITTPYTDSGGPLVAKISSSLNEALVIGIASWGEGCAVEGKYGIYTDVDYYIPWIKTVVKGVCPVRLFGVLFSRASVVSSVLSDCG